MALSKTIKTRIRKRSNNRCGYCLTHQQYLSLTLEIEHIVPKAKGGSDDESNLWLACRSCNLYKADQTDGFDLETQEMAPLFNPALQNWNEHFHWGNGGLRIEGISKTG